MVHTEDESAQQRLLIVAPEAKGQGLGRRLVDECLAFARQAGYRRISLWTNDLLEAALHIHEDVGFVRVAAEVHRRFRQPQVGETWEMAL